MAIMIPEHLPDSATAAERRVFGALQTLPDDAWVYYEPIVRRRYPDFIVIVPSVGVIVVEVKGYPFAWVQSVDWQQIVYMQAGREQTQLHPSRQARQYMTRLMEACGAHPNAQELKTNGHFNFALGHLSILIAMRRDELEQSPWNQFFPSENAISSDEYEAHFDAPEQIIACLRRTIDPEIPIRPLSPERIDLIRSAIHPEGKIRLRNRRNSISTHQQPDSQTYSGDTPVASIDRDQEEIARSMGGGHRIIYGVPGSGKTIILLYRAKMMSEAGKSVLFVCYNIPFAEYLEDALSEYPNVNVQTFGRWARDQGAPVDLDDKDAFGLGLLDIIGKGGGDAGKYDCVLVDEGQDFPQSWFRSVVYALKEPVGGELMIAYDLSQNLYRSDLPVWSRLGVNARGRTKRFRRNYRNTKQIVSAAHTFGAAESDNDDDRPHSVALHMDNCVREGPLPELRRQASLDAQIAFAATAVSEINKGDFLTSSGPLQAAAEDVMVLCRNNGLLKRIEGAFSKQGLKAKLSTIHSARGLQARAAILIGAEMLQGADDRPLLYVALTRPEDLLVVCWGHDTPLTKEIEQNVGAYRRLSNRS